MVAAHRRLDRHHTTILTPLPHRRSGDRGPTPLLDDGGGELVGVGAGRVEPAQRERLTAEGTLDQRGLVQVLGAQYRLESVGFGVDAARAAGRVVATSAAGS
jgi:hypothetical protein